MENIFESIFGTYDFENIPGVDNELLNKFSNFMMQSSRERAAKEKAAYEEKRKSFTWTIEPWKHTEEFDNKYQDGKNHTYYVLRNNKLNYNIELFCFRKDEIRKYEEYLNSLHFVTLDKMFEDRISDKIMKECYGDDWEKTRSPYHMYTYSVIFDTELGAVIYETDKKAFDHTFICFLDNIAEICQSNHDTVYFDMKNRRELITGKYDKVESKDYIILGKSNHFRDKESATIINKHTGEITRLN